MGFKLGATKEALQEAFGFVWNASLTSPPEVLVTSASDCACLVCLVLALCRSHGHVDPTTQGTAMLRQDVK